MSGSLTGFGGGGGVNGEGRERGARRRKLAGYLKAANDIRQSYQQSYAEKWGGSNGEFEEDTHSIPGAFPDVAIVSHGDEQLVLFPSYAKLHTKEPPNPDKRNAESSDSDGSDDAEYWAREWQKFEDDRAIVDVDVRGWIYSPHRGPMTRKNRLLIGLARQLSGIPAPKSQSREQSPDHSSMRAKHQEHEARREQERIAQEAEQILRRGEGEKTAAAQGRYSERPKDDSDNDSIYGDKGTSGSHTPSRASDEPPGPGHLSKRASWNQPSDMTQEELLQANSHLMARLRPFLTNPIASIAVTIFFYNEDTSVSRTVMTNEAGHFNMRSALEFIPTHVRILASEGLSVTEEVKITQPKGVSLISDVDDTIKHSSIGAGAREIFRNAFIRDLGDLTIDGVKEWYNTMYDMGVGIHYVSNSPWQLFPVLVSFFRMAGLPPGSYHLKQYSGMLQGIFEPVAERKKGTLERIMRDFPDRKFILVGDSGEADLEVYTDVVLANPGKILAVFIRDVTTPETQGFFNSAMGPLSGDRRLRSEQSPDHQSIDSRLSSPKSVTEQRPALPARPNSEVVPQTSSGPAMGKLIDFDDEEAQNSDVHHPHRRVVPRSVSTYGDLDSPRRRSAPDSDGRIPPPRPSKPLALRGAASINPDPAMSNSKSSPPPPPKPRRANAVSDSGQEHPLKQAYNAADIKPAEDTYMASARSKVSAAYNALPEMRSYIPGRGYYSQSPSPEHSSSTTPSGRPAPPQRRATGSSTLNAVSKRLSWNSTDTSDDESYRPSNANNAVPINKKLELWKRRWKRAKDVLDGQGVALRAWRVGGDVAIEAVKMVEKSMTSMGVEGYGHGTGNGNGNGKSVGGETGKTGDGGGEVKVKDLKRR